MMKPFPNLNEIYSIVQQEEKSWEISADLSPKKAMSFSIKDFNINTLKTHRSLIKKMLEGH